MLYSEIRRRVNCSAMTVMPVCRVWTEKENELKEDLLVTRGVLKKEDLDNLLYETVLPLHFKLLTIGLKQKVDWFQCVRYIAAFKPLDFFHIVND